MTSGTRSGSRGCRVGGARRLALEALPQCETCICRRAGSERAYSLDHAAADDTLDSREGGGVCLLVAATAERFSPHVDGLDTASAWSIFRNWLILAFRASSSSQLFRTVFLAARLVVTIRIPTCRCRSLHMRTVDASASCFFTANRLGSRSRPGQQPSGRTSFGPGRQISPRSSRPLEHASQAHREPPFIGRDMQCALCSSHISPVIGNTRRPPSLITLPESQAARVAQRHCDTALRAQHRSSACLRLRLAPLAAPRCKCNAAACTITACAGSNTT